MKKFFFAIGVTLVKGAMAVLYSVFKCFSVNPHKVVFLSRQSDSISLDFSRLMEELDARPEHPGIAVICCTLDHPVRYGWATIRSLYHLATSKVCVLDTYWPAVSLLHHKKELFVIQMWHSIGKIKQSGLVSVGRKGGRSTLAANALKMHANYDLVVAGSAVFNPYYCDSFGITPAQICNVGLPRIDYLMEDHQQRQRLEEQFPEIKGRKVVLYAPTFRRGMETGIDAFCKAVREYPTVAAFVKGHPLQRIERSEQAGQEIGEGLLFDAGDSWSTMDLLKACDYLITDYSAIAIEAACIRKRTMFWIYDYEEYQKNNGLNIPVREVAGKNASADIRELFTDICGDVFDEARFEQYISDYAMDDLGHAAADLADIVIGHLEI